MTRKGFWGSSAVEPRRDTCVWQLLGVGNRLLAMWFPTWSSLFPKKGTYSLAQDWDTLFLGHDFFIHWVQTCEEHFLALLRQTSLFPAVWAFYLIRLWMCTWAYTFKQSLSPDRCPFFVHQTIICLIIFTNHTLLIFQSPSSYLQASTSARLLLNWF